MIGTRAQRAQILDEINKNPIKAIQKPSEAFKSFPEGFWFHRARTQSRGSTLTACGRATLDGVKRHPHPRGCSSFRVAPSGSAEDGERGKAPNLGQGTSPLWGAGAKPLALQSTSYIQPVTGWCNLLHQLTNGVLRATLECSKERHGRLAERNIIMHVTKYTKGTLGHMLGHYDRTKDGLGENVVSERTRLNYNLAVEDQPLKQLDFVHKRLGEVRCLKRKDVNVLCDWVITMPKDLADEYREPFFKAAYNFFAEKYGRDNVVSAYVHMDEMQPHMHFAFVPVVADRKRDGWKLSAKEAITRADLQHIHEQMQTQLTQELGVPVNLLNEATIEGNRSIKELKRGTAIEVVNKLKSEQKEITQNITYLEDRQKAVADRYEADVFRSGVLSGEYTDGTEELPEYAQISRINRQKVTLPLDAYQKERRALEAAKTGEQAATAALESLMQSVTVQHIDELEEKNREQRKQIKELTERLNELERWKDWNETEVTLRQQVIDGVNATYRKLSQFAAEEFVDIWRKEVHEQMPLVTWQSKVDLANAIARGRKKSFKELQDEYNKFLEKRRGKPYKKDSERDWSKDKDKNNDLEF